ncbi:MAG: DUF2480 family protein [Bacteroidota bacterium]
MEEPIVNRIAQSPILTFKLEEHYPAGERVLIDIKDQLFMGMILREKDFRAWIKEQDWSQYQDQHIAITCSADAIIQVWAYMLLASRLQPYAKTIVFGTLEDLELQLWQTALDEIDFAEMEGRPVVVKGCSNIEVPAAIYMETTKRLMPFAKKISYGEPCSTVPIWKKR